MAAYVISYDLRSPGRDYAPLIKALRDAGAIRPLESVWLLDSVLAAGALRDRLTSMMDSNDGVLVIEIGPAWGSKGILENAVEWLKARRP
jgi:hypothetical protein